MTVKILVKIILLFSSTILYSQNLTGYEIKGKILNADNKKLFISLRNRNELPIDSCIITNSSFTLKGNVRETDYYKLFIEDHKGNKPIIISNAKIYIEGNADSIWMARIGDDIENKYSNILKNKLDSIELKPNIIDNSQNTEEKIPDSIMVKLLMQQTGNVVNKPLLVTKKFITDNPNSFESLWQLISYYKAFGQEESIELYDILSDDLKQHSLAITYKPIIVKAKEIDLKYLSSELKNPEDNIENLDSLEWDYLLIEFWASWCGPCRRAIPYLKEVYEKYHPSGFETLSVSIDESKDAWLKAINEENIKWHNLSDLKGFNKGIAKKYGIIAIPTSYLVNKKGEIIIENPKEKELTETLMRLYDNNKY